MNILITGGSGLIGTALCRLLLNKNHTLIVLTRNAQKAREKLNLDDSKSIRYIHHFSDIKTDERINAVINLAGESIVDKRWSSERKKIIHDSRILLTSQLISHLKTLKIKPEVLISGSAVGFYGDSDDNILTEHSEATDEFSHQLCDAWEMQALRAKALGMRVCILRTGVVLDSNGGMIKKLLPSFRAGLGAQLGDGKQWMSWIHLVDIVNIIDFLLQKDQLNGFFNAASPTPVTNKTFTKAFAQSLSRPAFLTLPAPLLRLMFGEMSHILLTGQRVIPKKLIQAGFQFQYPKIESALSSLTISNKKYKNNQ